MLWRFTQRAFCAIVRAALSAGRFSFDANMDLAALKFDLAVLEREERVVATDADVESRVKPGPALTHDNRAAVTSWPPYALTPRYCGLLSARSWSSLDPSYVPYIT